MKCLTLDLASLVFLGEKLGPEADRLNRAFVDAVRGGSAFIRIPVPGLWWWKGLRGRRILERFFGSRVRERRAGSGTDLFSRLCRARTEEGDSFTDRDVVDHMIFLMMAAHDTTTITLSTMTYYLAKFPEWQERLRAESRALGKPRLDYDDLEKLPSATLAMKEALRLCAPVPGLPRRTVRDTEFAGYRLPKGTYVTVQIFFTHLMEEHWPEPERFDPERFAEAPGKAPVNPWAWLPFGGGAHKCLGMNFAELEVKAVLHQMLLRYRWSVPQGYEMPIAYSSLPKPKDDLPVTLETL